MTYNRYVTDAMIAHRLIFPLTDLRYMVKLHCNEIQAQCRGMDFNREQFARFKVEVRRLSAFNIFALRQILIKLNVKGAYKYTKVSAAILAAEFNLGIQSKRPVRKNPTRGAVSRDESIKSQAKSVIEIVDKSTSSSSSGGFVDESTIGDDNPRMDDSTITLAQSMPQVSRSFERGLLEIKLDAAQRKAVDKAKECKLTLLNAGPGTGKTTTLCLLTSELMSINERPKVLFLSYSTKAEAVMIERIKDSGGSNCFIPKEDVFQTPGVSVMTFDKFAYQLTKNIGSSYYINKQDALQELRRFSQQGVQLLDYLIVDECQDLRLVEYQMMEELRLISAKTVLAGDPKQECFADARYFTDLWCSSITKVGEVAKIHLSNNYRSCQEIVNVLNNYAQIHFPNIGGAVNQVSMRGPCYTKGGPEGTCVHVINCMSKASIGRAVAENLKYTNPDDIYVIAPVTIKTYGYESTFLTLLNEVNGYKGIDVGCKAMKGTKVSRKAAIKDTDLPFTIGTSMKLKGGEAKSVHVYGFDSKYNVDHIGTKRQLKLLYVALSRAMDDLYVYIDYDMPPTFLHLALEGSVLIRRHGSSTCNVTTGITQGNLGSMKLSVEGVQSNKSIPGGLSQCTLDTVTVAIGSIPCYLNINSSLLDELSNYILTKQILENCVLDTVGGHADPSLSAKVALDVAKGQLGKQTPSEWRAFDVLQDDAKFLEVLDGDMQKFGKALCEVVATFQMWTFLNFRGALSEISTKDIPPTRFQGFKVYTERCMRVTYHIPNSESDGLVAPNLGCQADLVFAFKHHPVDTHFQDSLVLNFVCHGSGISSDQLTRAAMCASLCNCSHGMVVHTTTGKYVFVEAISSISLGALTRATCLSGLCCLYGMKSISMPSFLHTVTCIHVMQTVGDKLYGLTMFNFTIKSSTVWNIGEDQFEHYTLTRGVSEWLETHAPARATLLVVLGPRASDILGDLCTTWHSMGIKQLCAHLAVDCSDDILKQNLITLSGSNCGRMDGVNVANILHIACPGIRTHIGTNVEYEDSIATFCMLKAILNWDTAI